MDINQPPRDVYLSKIDTDKNLEAGAIVGYFITDDDNQDQIHTYTITQESQGNIATHKNIQMK